MNNDSSLTQPEYTVADVPLGFAPIPPQLIMWQDEHGKALSGTELRLWSLLAMHRDLRTQETSAGTVRMANMLGVDRTTAQRAANRLIEAGFLLHQRRQRDHETGEFTPAIFTLAINKKPLRFGVIDHDAHHDASTHTHDAHHDAHHEASVHTKRYIKKEKDISPEGAPADELPDGQDLGPSLATTAAEFIAYLAEELDGADVPLLAGRKARYGKEFNEHLKKGVGDGLLYRCADRIIERWFDANHAKLTVEQAYQDVTNGSAPRHTQSNVSSVGTASPPAVKEALLAHDTLRRYAYLADEWDFTKEQPPPYKIAVQLGGDQQERWANQDRMMSIAKRSVTAA